MARIGRAQPLKATVGRNRTPEILGTVAKTLGALTSSSAAAVAITGSLNKTLGVLTLSASGVGVQPITGTLSQTLGAATLSSVGTLALAGALTRTLGTATLSATGQVAITGSLSVTLGAVTLSGAGLLGGPVVGTLDKTLGALRLSATGLDPNRQVSTGAGRPKRPRRRHIVEIDDEEFEVDSLDEALELLAKAKEQAKELADKAIARAAKATKRPSRKIIQDARRALIVPEIEAPRELADAVQSVMADIRATYADAIQTIEITALLARREAEIERDDEEVLMLL